MIITSHLLKYLENNNILCDLQYGFRETRLCETQLVMLGEDIASKIAIKQVDRLLSSKTFDKINHENSSINYIISI